MRPALGRLLGALLSGPCLCCGLDAGGEDLCAGCRRDLPWLTPACARCGGPLPAAAACPGCLALFTGPAVLDRAWSALFYRYPVDHLVKAAKFGGQLATARALGRVLGEARRAVGETRQPGDTCLVPVPLHWRRHGERGFNQAWELARGAAEVLDLPVAPGLCRRLRPTPEQSGLPARDRRRNLQGAFQAQALRTSRWTPRRPSRWPRLVIIDDVFTTGATVIAVATALRAAGAREVEAWTLCRVP